MATGHFRSYVWDPALILSQIIAVQAAFYTTYGLWDAGINSIAGQPLAVYELFNSNISENPFELLIGKLFGSIEGRLQLTSFLLNSVTCAISLCLIVQRAKQCLDFTVTVHFFHLVFCSCIGGFPTTVHWWTMNVTSIILTSVISEYLCMKYEMKAIPVTVSGVS